MSDQPWPQFLIQQIPFWILTVVLLLLMLEHWRRHRSKGK